MKKKILSVILTAAMALSLTACGKDDGGNSAPAFLTSAVSKPASAPGSQSAADTPGSVPAAPESSAPAPTPGNVSYSYVESLGDPVYIGEPEMPKLIETRLYVSEGNHSWNYYVEIYDNGSWGISQELGNKEVYAGYSYSQEVAGEYVTVQSYNMATDPPTPKFEGNAKFTMTEAEFTVQFEDEKEPEVFVRHSLDEPLDW